MKTVLRISLAITLSFLFLCVRAQTDCKVLMPSITGSYKGECKKGLADGEGEASGIDSYTGAFKKGLPDGGGTYKWATGEVYKGEWKKGMRDGYGAYTYKADGIDVTQTGYWREDQYLGKELIPPYQVISKIGLSRVSFFRQGGIASQVTFKFARAGDTSFDIGQLMMQGSSGIESITTAFTGYQEVLFPFEGKVQFKAPNLLNTMINNYELRFKINQPGEWVVTLYY